MDCQSVNGSHINSKLVRPWLDEVNLGTVGSEFKYFIEEELISLEETTDILTLPIEVVIESPVYVCIHTSELV